MHDKPAITCFKYQVTCMVNKPCHIWNLSYFMWLLSHCPLLCEMPTKISASPSLGSPHPFCMAEIPLPFGRELFVVNYHYRFQYAKKNLHGSENNMRKIGLHYWTPVWARNRNKPEFEPKILWKRRLVQTALQYFIKLADLRLDWTYLSWWLDSLPQWEVDEDEHSQDTHCCHEKKNAVVRFK